MSSPMTIEEELRSRLEEELNTHQQALSSARAQLEEAQKLIESEENLVATLRAKLTKFDEIFGVQTPTPKAVKSVRPKAPPATKKTNSSVNNSRAAIGRREVAEGKRPIIRDAMIEVMGNGVMNATTIYESLKERNWLPNSNDPRAYIAYLLSSLRTTFERVEGRSRGHYRVKASVLSSWVPLSTRSNGHSTSHHLDATDAILADAGVLPAN